MLARFLTSSLFLVLTAFLGTAPAAVSNSPQKLRFNLYPVSCPAPDLALTDLKGSPVSLAGLRGKVVILNFWKIDCPPCTREKPILEKIFRKYGSRGLAIVCVNLFDDIRQQNIYAQTSNYSFTFAYNRDRLISVRSHTLPSGATSHFVVNAQAQAVYEVPGMPTTYLIDRQGEVVGNSVGMVNWEDRQLTELLESFLAAPSYSASTQVSGLFSTEAGQGSAGPVAQPSSPPVRVPQAPTEFAPTTPEPSPHSTFRGGGPTQQPPSAGSPEPRTSPPASGVDGARQHLVEPPLQPVEEVKKPEPTDTRVEKPAHAKPRGTSRTSQKPRTRPKPQSSRTTQSRPDTTRAGVPAGGNLPPLPAAIPYSPSNRGPSPADNAVYPGVDGTVQARVPGTGGPAPVPLGVDSMGGGLPAAQPMPSQGSGNPISGFIMDSFGGRTRLTPIAPPGGQVRQEPMVQRQQPVNAPVTAPPPGFFGQLGQDVKNLGTGIKDAVQRVIPLP